MALTFAVLGDSIAFGQGAARPQEILAARLAAALQDAGFAVDVQMLAVPGSRSDGLAAQVDRALRARPKLALIVVGANDLTHLVPPGLAASQLGAAVCTLRMAGVDVVVAPAPDMSAVPWVPPATRALVQAASRALQQAQSRAAHASGAEVVDMSEVAGPFSTDVTLFSADRFHPSSKGYARIATALTPAVLAAARRAGG